MKDELFFKGNVSGSTSRYQIKVKGHLQSKWADWFDGIVLELNTSTQQSVHTVLIVKVPDQAALRGVLNQMWDLNLCLISVNLINEPV